ncbi:hypothetical protein PG993_005926 [Apiospora rasikravindrae]|uniref:Uncharacterized protein n=1 Tax=Apiospora rasikravindrae TaxID=990691 RepID=A0ABR1TA60_9PEZI
MDQSAHMAELLEGSTPASPPQQGRPELAPGWGRPAPGESVTGDVPESQTQQNPVPQRDLTHDSFDRDVNSLESYANFAEEAMVPFSSTENVNQGFDIRQGTSQQQLVRTGPTQSVTGPRSAFPPAHVTDLATGFYHTLHDSHPIPRMTTGGYRGTQRAQATQVDENDNCCLFLTGFPAHITVREFIHQVQAYRLGKVAAIHITSASANHPRAAIKVTMWTREGAVRLHNSIQSQLVTFPGHTLRAQWNRHRVGPQTAENESRVILVIGRPEHHFTFKLDKLVVNNFNTQIMFVVYSFGSYVNQASNAYRLIKDSYDPDHVSVVYRQDPCEPQPLPALDQ